MPLPYTGRKGEQNFEEDFVAALKNRGWNEEVLYHKTIPELIENWKNIIFERNRTRLNNVPLSDSEMDRLMDTVRSDANSPVKANILLQGKEIPVKRDSDSPDTRNAGNDVFLNIFSPGEIAGGTSKYQIAEQVVFNQQEDTRDRRGDVTLLINGMPVIHIELKASGVDISEATNQIKKYIQERKFQGFMGLVQVFWAITPEDALYFSNPGDAGKMNSAFFFHWGDRDSNIISDWKELIDGESRVLSIPEAHQLIGYYAIADKSKDTLKICRSYQSYAIKAIVNRVSQQQWGDHNQRGGFVWCTTGGGKTMTSFKAGQLIIDRGYADKVVFLVDRIALNNQSKLEYNSFAPVGREVLETKDTSDLFNKLVSSKAGTEMLISSIQKISRITDENVETRKDELEKIKAKRIVFIVDEAHRSQFGEMHQNVKKTFFNALFFGFTGTPIFPDNMREGEMTTESVFGKCLAVYSLATGIRDGNVLGFFPIGEKTYEDKDLREKIALAESNSQSVDEAKSDPEKWKKYRYFREKAPMATEYEDNGDIKKDNNGRPLKGIEDYLPAGQYDNDDHRKAVVKNISDNFASIANGENGTLFHSILATTSIPEAYEYWKLFKNMAPDLNVTTLFDANVDSNSGKEFEKEKALIEIVSDYSKTYGLDLDWKTDSKCVRFKEDLMARLSHSKPYTMIGNDHRKCLDIVIVVDQLLTGFDSQYVNVLYLDKVLENDNLIQAISRTNRVYDNNEKPLGLVKFFRKIYSMKRNLDDALKLYCQGDYADVKVDDLDDNIISLNSIYKKIVDIFKIDQIDNFDQLPKFDENRQRFRKEFYKMKSTLRTAMLQGMKWENEFGKKLDFDERTYRILNKRYQDLPSNGGGGGGKKKPGYNIPTNLSTIEMDKIDADYLEAQFKIVTLRDIAKQEDQLLRQANAIEEIKKNIGVLPESKQKYAKQVLEDIRSGILIVEEGKTFLTYIQEYSDRSTIRSIELFAAKFNLDFDLFYSLYSTTIDGKVDTLKLEAVEKTADLEKAKQYFNTTSNLAVKGKLHNELKTFIEEKKADLV
ncbi:MAG: type I restriction endonuclease subunit R [Ruminococcus sp.]|nr:type I restriction endonuclease subunit R [Ruminococcus sp.]